MGALLALHLHPPTLHAHGPSAPSPHLFLETPKPKKVLAGRVGGGRIRLLWESVMSSSGAIREEVPVVLAFEEAYGARAVAAWVRVWSASNDLIRARFDLGKLVYAALQSGAYGDGVVVRLTARLSRESGKLVPPTILYEVAQLYMAFGGQYARVEALRARLTFPLTGLMLSAAGEWLR